ncbi:CBU_0592 family membrane protein [Primorskyibacter sp. S87]|uniref:CBU_0592 family membrane protein n=1 Tax=Primorskyibacter sp. S87 TaxID=3415126 RepID=UPI003C7B06FD
MMDDLHWADIVGLFGSVFIIVAYYFATRGKLKADEMAFNLWNILGGSLVMVSLVARPNLGAIVIEVMFLFIAATAVLRILRAKP